MKICMCSFTGFKSLNGANLRVYHLTKELVKRGHEISFIAPHETDAESCRKAFGVPAKSVGLSIERFKSSRLKLYPIFAWKARKMVDRDADMVFGQSLPSALAVRLSRGSHKRVIDYVDLWSEYWLYAHPGPKGKAIYKAVRKAEGYSMKNADMVFTITKRLKKMMLERGCKREKVRIVRDGVDTSMFRPMRVPDRFLNKYNLDRKTDYIVYQGGIGAHDGVQFLVESAPAVLKKLPHAKFLIVGRGDYLDEIKRMVSERKLEKSFIFTGWVPYSDMPFFMNIARLNIVPLPDAPATQGVVTLKLFEAMACGTPTIIGDLPGVREHMNHGDTAFLTRSENTEGLASSITELLEDKALYTRISRNGLKLVPGYDWRMIARDMADLMVR